MKKYRHPTLDKKLSAKRLTQVGDWSDFISWWQESRALVRCRKCGVDAPATYYVDLESRKLYLEFIEGEAIKHTLYRNPPKGNERSIDLICRRDRCSCNQSWNRSCFTPRWERRSWGFDHVQSHASTIKPIFGIKQGWYDAPNIMRLLLILDSVSLQLLRKTKRSICMFWSEHSSARILVRRRCFKPS